MLAWQGEERDSSDEEWEAAYAALDPSAQVGWGHRRGQVTEVGANLVRDLFAAADTMHDHAMSEMDGNTEMEEGSPTVGAGAGEDSPSICVGNRADTLDSMEDGLPGESPNPVDLITMCVTCRVLVMRTWGFIVEVITHVLNKI